MSAPACVSCWPGLHPALLWPRRPPGEPPYPLCAPDRGAFHAARAGIYHLARALARADGDHVLMPDYHSGAEVWAIRAAGLGVRYYHINRRMEPDLEEIRALCEARPIALYLIHYLGWPQPVREAAALCRERGMALIEDCALSFLSRLDGRPLGSFGDYAVFCLYKTLPVPNGGIVVRNDTAVAEFLWPLCRPLDSISLGGRMLELLLIWAAGRAPVAGGAALKAKRGAGRLLTRAGIDRIPVGDINPDFSTAGFAPEALEIGMSRAAARLLAGFDYAAIVAARRRNYRILLNALAGRGLSLREDLPEGVCPLFFPILVEDKPATARALRQYGIEAVEFWDYGYPEARDREGPDARFLRRHLLEIPIHQEVRTEQVEFMADQLRALKPRPAAGRDRRPG
ncbi:MAG: DegT/DnrJ/EryC1/StrS family aminotransferase [Candidatus Polarisedimenticolia bacterium]